MFLNKPVLQATNLVRAKSLCRPGSSLLAVSGSGLLLFWAVVIKVGPDLIAPSQLCRQV